MADPSRPALASALSYRDPLAALDWLEAAFGLERTLVITDSAGVLAHAEMCWADSRLIIGPEWTDRNRSPASIGGLCTQTVHVQLDQDVDAHCERARAAGAVISQEPATQFYGDRTYRAVDPEGHIWTFGQRVEAVSREQAEAATGLKIDGWA